MSDATPEVQAKAREMGWRPSEEFRGNPDNWVDADEYVRRGEEVLPLVKAENKRLSQQTEALAGEIRRLAGVVSEQRASMDALAEFSAAQLRDKLAEQKRALTAQLRAAERDEDDTAAARLETALEANEEAREKLKAPAAAPAQAPAQAPVQQPESPEFRAWRTSNAWYGGDSKVDKAKTAAAHRFAQEAAARGLKGDAFFAAVDADLAEVYPAPTKRADPSEEGRPSGGGGSGSSEGSFKTLPADAKAQAKKQADRFVGPNKMFKTEAEWNAYYAKQYYAAEA